ncbi:M20/M25/M40 family metallo-hydrolase [Marinococcus luteus]|uniref:M20/M25/M40 family metallo-hydrolase n=1 Tax=Marinococcus luteus TaxID=1122204 RepID=UPI002ACCF290|nr:M20/M25/M40 family metallo-hydrolase [Marinococcus luteus]MDZ5783876.1 M20/M25/M40 family metallo-hydrolase [Marinococcus luteus]
MYENLKSLTTAEQAEYLTEYLVEWNSVNASDGEVSIARELYRILRTFPYFQQFPERIWLEPVHGDPHGRQNVFAFIKGLPSSAQTILYHSHIDTVGIEDYGNIKHQACSPKALLPYFQSYTNDPEVHADAQSGDWMFGRGSVDMKSGIAVHLVNLLYFSEHPEELEGNILLLLNPDEESEHCGLIGALPVLRDLKRSHGLQYLLAINNDFIAPLYEGDTTKYIYTGTAGKLLPAFFVFGREVHVGDTLAGVDPNFVAAKLTARIHNNYDLTEHIPGELILPPTCLYQRDTKESYTVQTASGSRLYFNYFLYETTAEQVTEQMLQAARRAAEESEQYFASQYDRYIEVTGMPPKNISWEIDVKTYENYRLELEQKGLDTQAAIQKRLSETAGMDLRLRSFELVHALRELDPDKTPQIIFFYAPPFLPHNYLTDANSRHREMKTFLSSILQNNSASTGEIFEMRNFFPYLSDGSFLSIQESDAELAPLLKNLPEGDTLYPVPVNAIKQLNISSINMGVYGKDGHKWTERVYKPYSFHVLPGLIRDTTTRILHEFAAVKE